MTDGFIAKKTLALGKARAVAAAAETEALRHGFTMCIAVVDDGGHLLSFQRLDGTQIGSIDVAVGKARTALSFKRPTKTLEEFVQAGGITAMTIAGAVMLDGGLPLIHDGTIVGAIGVSGGRPHQDGQVAAAGAAMLG